MLKSDCSAMGWYDRMKALRWKDRKIAWRRDGGAAEREGEEGLIE